MTRRTASFTRSLMTTVVGSAVGLGLLLGSSSSLLAGTPASAAPTGDMEFAATGDAPPSPMLDRATKFYDRKDFYSASIELQKIISGESKDDPRNVQQAQFFMGKTMYQLKFYAGALYFFEEIVKAGETHAFFKPTLKWLAALSHVLPETSGILEKIGLYDEAALEDESLKEVRDELFYLLGRHYYKRADDGDFGKAVLLFQKVSDQSEFYIKAKFFEGVTYVRQYDGASAIEAFKAILKIGRERPAQYKAEDIAQYEKLAILQMARVFYSTQQYQTSIKYFEKLDQDSPDWTKSLFEASWAYFMLTNNSKALGNIHTLNAPYFEDEFFPESVLLKAVIYFKYCLYDRALEAVGEFDGKYRPLKKNLEELIKKYDDKAEFYEYIKKVMAGTAGLDDETQRLVMSALGDKTIKKEFDWVEELNRELEMLNSGDKSWQGTGVASLLLEELTLRKSLADTNAGQAASDRVERLAQELGKLGSDGRRIQFEILNAMSDKASADIIGSRVGKDHKEEPIVVDDEHFMWKFNGEYWKDELGYYRFRIRSQCPK